VNEKLFESLRLTKSDINLSVGAATHPMQTTETEILAGHGNQWRISELLDDLAAERIAHVLDQHQARETA
jgi:hypothetical protein